MVGVGDQVEVSRAVLVPISMKVHDSLPAVAHHQSAISKIVPFGLCRADEFCSVASTRHPARPSGLPELPVAIENLVAGLAGYAEIPTDLCHGLPIQKTGDKAQAFFHDRTRFPWHPHLPPQKSEKCNPCVRYEMSPMSRVAQRFCAPSSTAF